jgi:hypothetical protein
MYVWGRSERLQNFSLLLQLINCEENSKQNCLTQSKMVLVPMACYTKIIYAFLNICATVDVLQKEVRF